MKITNPQIKKLRSDLSFLTLNLRKTIFPKNIDVCQPQSERIDTVLFNGKIRKRKRIVLLSPGCSIATCTMCPLPNEAIDPKCKRITVDDMITQVKNAFAKHKKSTYEVVTIYTNSNFFVDDDIPSSVREYIYEEVAKSPAKYLVVESLPQFITEKEIKHIKKTLGKKKLSVAIGLQSSNDMVRELAINSTCTKKGFEKTVKLLTKYGYYSQVFLMIKPPFLLEKEAIKDTVNSIKYLTKFNIKDPILCATRVAPDTLVNLLYKKQLFTSPYLWTIVEILKQAKKLSPKSKPRVAVGELHPEDNPGSTCTSNHHTCDKKIIKSIEKYNKDHKISELNKIKCSCLDEYINFMDQEIPKWQDLSIPDRIKSFLK